MRIMLDSNIIISVAIFNTSAMKDFVNKVERKHTLVLSNIIINECLRVVKAKFPAKIMDFESFLARLYYEYIFLPETFNNSDFQIRDEFDKKILYSAYATEIDVLVTGDKDFFEIKYEGLEILTPSDFMKKYG